jgi:hypothetical protein
VYERVHEIAISIYFAISMFSGMGHIYEVIYTEYKK